MRHLKRQITEAISGSLKTLSYPAKGFSLTPPKNPDFGDLSSNISLLLTKEIKKPPMEIAQSIADEIKKDYPHDISEITVTPPGFINFRITNSFYQSKVKTILEGENSFGAGTQGIGKTANV